MNDKINTLNKLMVEFYDRWEKENTSEMFMMLNGSNDTKEIELNIEKNNKRLSEIENLINEEENFELIIENWNSIDLKLLDSLVQTFEIDLQIFVEKLNNSKANNEIKQFFIIE